MKENVEKIDFTTWNIEDWKKKLKEINQITFKPDTNFVDISLLSNMSFGGYKGNNFYLWSFSYIAIEEDHRSRKNSHKLKDEGSEFFDSFCEDALDKTNGFLMYVILSAKCENLQSFVNTKKNFEACLSHFGNYFVSSEIHGFLMTQDEKLPQFIRVYEEKDILVVKEVKNNQSDWLENVIQKKGEFGFEKVLNEKIF